MEKRQSTFKDLGGRTKTDLQDSSKFASKRGMKFGIDFANQNFLKGGGTTPLVSNLMGRCERNDDMLQVYERLKFFTKE